MRGRASRSRDRSPSGRWRSPPSTSTGMTASRMKIQLAAGQLSFGTRTYPDNTANYPNYPTRHISVSVADKDAARARTTTAAVKIHWDTESIQIEVKNVAPSFARHLGAEGARRRAPWLSRATSSTRATTRSRCSRSGAMARRSRSIRHRTARWRSGTQCEHTYQPGPGPGLLGRADGEGRRGRAREDHGPGAHGLSGARTIRTAFNERLGAARRGALAAHGSLVVSAPAASIFSGWCGATRRRVAAWLAGRATRCRAGP